VQKREEREEKQGDQCKKRANACHQHVCSYSPLHLGLSVLQESAAILACMSKPKRGAPLALHRGRMNLGARDKCLRSVLACARLCVLRCVHMMRSIHKMQVMIMMIMSCMNVMNPMITITMTVVMTGMMSVHEMPVMMMILRCVHTMQSIHIMPLMMKMGHFPSQGWSIP
jgi:hypothetical protein